MYSHDMKYHDHVTMFWPRCSHVERRGENLVCDLDWEHKYDLADKRAQLHVRFLNLKTDEELMRFIGAWGPLWQAMPAQVVTPRANHWAFQKRLKAGLGLVHDARFNDAASLKRAILEYVSADDDEGELGPAGKPGEWGATALHLSMLYTGNIHRHPKDWIPNAPLRVLRRVATNCLYGNLSFDLHGTWEGGRLRHAWTPALYTLAQAIELELWNSLTGVRPVTICDECRTAFSPDSAHLRKFCSYKCAHRVAMRLWRKNADGQPGRKRGKYAKAKKA
jgi:hypothetical protein